MAKILLIEDEEPIREMLHFALGLANFQLYEADTGAKGLSLLQENAIDLVLLDWMLPDQPGIEVAKKIRAGVTTEKLPIIMLTALAEENHKVRALGLGADDYVVKPFSPMELIARIQAVLRRSQGVKGSVLSHDGIVLKLNEQKAWYAEQPLPLTRLEFKLLQHFLEHPRQVFSRDQLLNAVWGYTGYVSERTVDAHIKKLRRILKEAGCQSRIVTERGIGYRWSEND